MRYSEFYLGGIAYNLKVDTRHVSTMIELAVHVATGALSKIWKSDGNRIPHACLGEIVYQHTSVLPQGRFNWLESILKVCDKGWAITMDSDTWIEPFAAIKFLAMLPANPPSDMALIGGLVPTRDGRPNAWTAPGKRIQELEIVRGGLTPCRQIGLALAAYNLAWYKRQEDRHTSFAIMAGQVPGTWIGEDVWHCEWINKRSGTVWTTGLDVPTIHGGQ